MISIKKNEECSPNKKHKILIVFGDMVADMLSNKKLNPTIIITQSYFAVPKNLRRSSTHYFIMKVPNKREFQQIAFNHSSDINFKDFKIFTKNVL